MNRAETHGESRGQSELVTGLSRKETLVFIAIVAVAAAVPWTVPHWPSQDGQNHLAVAHILRHFADPGSPFRNYLTIQTGLRPSTAIYTILVALAGYMDLGTAERALVSFAIALVPLAALLLVSRSLPRRARNMFLLLPFPIGWALAMGFLSFQIALGFGLLALAFAWPIAGDQARATRDTLLAACAFVLCIWFHPVTGVITGVAYLLLEGPRMLNLRTWPRMILAFGPGTLFLAVGYLAAGAPPHESALPGETMWPTPWWRAITDLLDFTIAYSPLELIPRCIALAILFAFAGRELRSRFFGRRTEASGNSGWRGATPETAFGRAVLGFFVLYFAAPHALSGWFYCSTRFYVVALFFLPAAAEIPKRFHRFLAPTGAALGLLAVAVQVPNIASTSRQMQDIVDVGTDMPRGSKLIPMDFTIREMGPQPLGHSWAELVRERDVVASQIFAAGKPRMGGERFRTLSFLPGVLDVVSGTLPWSTYETWYDVAGSCRREGDPKCAKLLAERKTALDKVIDRYDYILMLDPPGYAQKLFAARTELAKRVGAAWLYRIVALDSSKGPTGGEAAPK